MFKKIFFLSFKKNIYSFSCARCSLQHEGSLFVACKLRCSMWLWFPDQGSSPGPLHWEHRVPVTGPPGKFPMFRFWFATQTNTISKNCNFSLSIPLEKDADFNSSLSRERLLGVGSAVIVRNIIEDRTFIGLGEPSENTLRWFLEIK